MFIGPCSKWRSQLHICTHIEDMRYFVDGTWLVEMFCCVVDWTTARTTSARPPNHLHNKCSLGNALGFPLIAILAHKYTHKLAYKNTRWKCSIDRTVKHPMKIVVAATMTETEQNVWWQLPLKIFGYTMLMMRIMRRRQPVAFFTFLFLLAHFLCRHLSCVEIRFNMFRKKDHQIAEKMSIHLEDSLEKCTLEGWPMKEFVDIGPHTLHCTRLDRAHNLLT